MASALPKTVLYVDDDHYLQVLVKAALTSTAQLAVHTCSSGQQALEELRFLAPDLILLDAAMPGMDGATTLTELRKMRGLSDVPVIFLTGHADDCDIAHYCALGAIGVIVKPIEPLRLAEKVAAVWNNHDWPCPTMR
jgi:two-component system OmpR family response regulator